MSFNWKASIIWTVLMVLLFISTLFPFYMGGLGGAHFIAMVRDQPYDPNTYWDSLTNSEEVLDYFIVGLFVTSLNVFKLSYALIFAIGLYYINSEFFDGVKSKLVRRLLEYRITKRDDRE